MKSSITRKKDLTTSKWSGGTTTELAIFPPGSSLRERNFSFRLSTAKVVSESSEFTRLPGVRRVIMVLEGQLELEHAGHYSKIIKQYETDIFEGGWETRSKGTGTDFNMMTTGKTSGTLEMVRVDKDCQMRFSFKEEGNILGFYVLKGIMDYSDGEKSEILESGDFLLVFPENQNEIVLFNAVQDSEFILTRIDFR